MSYGHKVITLNAFFLVFKKTRVNMFLHIALHMSLINTPVTHTRRTAHVLSDNN